MTNLKDNSNYQPLIEILADETLLNNKLQIEEFSIETPEDFEAFVENTLFSENNQDLNARFGIWGQTMNHIHIITDNWEQGFIIAKVLEQKISPILNPTILDKLYERIIKTDNKETLFKLISSYNSLIKESSNLYNTWEH